MIQGPSKVTNGFGIGLPVPVLSRRDYMETILFVSPPGTISGAMEAAIEREFSWISVRHLPELHLACAKSETRIQLILVDLRFVSDLESCQSELTRQHPSAAMAIMIDGNGRVAESQLQGVNSCPMCGVLPLNVNLDVLLSILRIMLKGGEYFPVSVFRADTDSPVMDRIGVQFSGGGAPPSDKARKQAGGEIMIELTARELEILARVARGNQNKIIAADLGLSEHTVKIHIHNIITKLGVHNRTEAAILYLERTGSDATHLRRSGD